MFMKINKHNPNTVVNIHTMDGTIAPIDTKEAAITLGIEERAEADAQAGIPLPNSDFPSATEATIRDYVSQKVNDYIQWGNFRVQFNNQTMASNEVQTDVVLGFENAVQKFEKQDIPSWIADYGSDLNQGYDR